MPRFLPNASKVKTSEKIQRAKAYRVSGYKDFHDPFPIGFGTLPEKMVYAALSRRGIPFEYLNNIDLSFPEIEVYQTYQADFIIPSLRIIIEVQGAHWHSMPNAIAEDAFKFALYQQAGWKPLAWWDFDIINNINDLFLQTPELNAAGTFPLGLVSSEMAVRDRTKTDTSQGIRTLNQRRAQRLQYRKKAATVKVKKQKNYGGYITNGR